MGTLELLQYDRALLKRHWRLKSEEWLNSATIKNGSWAHVTYHLCGDARKSTIIHVSWPSTLAFHQQHLTFWPGTATRTEAREQLGGQEVTAPGSHDGFALKEEGALLTRFPRLDCFSKAVEDRSVMTQLLEASALPRSWWCNRWLIHPH